MQFVGPTRCPSLITVSGTRGHAHSLGRCPWLGTTAESPRRRPNNPRSIKHGLSDPSQRFGELLVLKGKDPGFEIVNKSEPSEDLRKF